MPHLFFFFFNDTATTEIYTLSLHDALPILSERRSIASVFCSRGHRGLAGNARAPGRARLPGAPGVVLDGARRGELRRDDGSAGAASRRADGADSLLDTRGRARSPLG